MTAAVTRAVASRADVVAAARPWLGTPWRHQARLKGVAVDCAGLVIGVARELGLVAPDFDVSGYARNPDGTLLQLCDRFMQRVFHMEPGDVLVLRFDRDPQHMGIVADYPRAGHLSLIHALNRANGRGHVVEHRLDAALARRVVAMYRLPGVC